MQRYLVTIQHDACTTSEVKASSESDAIASAMHRARPMLCHHCSRKLDLGEPLRAVYVENIDSGDANDEPEPDVAVVQLRSRVAELEAALDRMAENARAIGLKWD